MMKRDKNAKYWLPRVAALSAAAAVYVLLTHFPAIWNAIRTFIGYFSPLLLGCAIAYVVNPLANRYRSVLCPQGKRGRRSRIISVVLAYITVLAILALLLIILVPQLMEGISVFNDNIDSYLETLRSVFPGLKAFEHVLNMQNILASREKLLSTVAAALKNNYSHILELSAVAGKSLIQWLIGLFLSMYLLADKDRLKANGGRLLRALLPSERYTGVLAFLRRCDSILNRYVVYNLLDSLIIGAANAVFMAVMGIPYIGLVSFIVAVTNLIPTFGPIIGGAVCALLLCLVKLRYAVIFLAFTAVLQLCDAYLVKPKLFGSRLGVSSLWILVGIIAGGRMFGALGVLLAIPGVAVLDFLYSDYLLPRLEKRSAAQQTETASQGNASPQQDDLPCSE